MRLIILADLVQHLCRNFPWINGYIDLLIFYLFPNQYGDFSLLLWLCPLFIDHKPMVIPFVPVYIHWFRIPLKKLGIILPKAIYRYNAIPIKIPTQFFIELERAIVKFICNNRKTRIAKTILISKRNSGGISISDLKQY